MQRVFRYKQVIVVRADLDLSKGKLAVQVAHASELAIDATKRLDEQWFYDWFNEGYRKIVLKVQSLEELLRLKEEAEREKLPVATVIDFGLTELPPDTVTAIGIGPAPSERIDTVTGRLSLLH